MWEFKIQIDLATSLQIQIMEDSDKQNTTVFSMRMQFTQAIQ